MRRLQFATIAPLAMLLGQGLAWRPSRGWTLTKSTSKPPRTSAPSSRTRTGAQGVPELDVHALDLSVDHRLHRRLGQVEPRARLQRRLHRSGRRRAPTAPRPAGSTGSTSSACASTSTTSPARAICTCGTAAYAKAHLDQRPRHRRPHVKPVNDGHAATARRS